MNLTRIRKLRGLSLEALGEMIGKDPSTVHRAEKMHQSAKLETYQLCADALGVTLSDLFCEDLTLIESELLQAFRSVPEEQRAVFSGLIEMARSRAQALGREGNPAHEGSAHE